MTTPKVGDLFVFRSAPDVVHTVARIQQTMVGSYVHACCRTGYPADQVRRVEGTTPVHCKEG